MTAPPPLQSRALLLVNGVVHSPADPFATAMLVVGESVAWVGSDAAGRTSAPADAEVLDLDGALVTAAFVDAHVHLTATGLRLPGWWSVRDLGTARSAADLLGTVREMARAADARDTVLGEGFDESVWPDPTLPSLAELDRAADGRPVLLGRVDAHSSLASSALLDAAGIAPPADGGARLFGDAHTAAEAYVLERLPAERRAAAQGAALAHAASLGIGAVHEMAGPGFGGEEDLRALLTRGASVPDASTGEQGPVEPDVVAYWGELDGFERAARLGALGAAGDVLADGTLGSRTAALREAYADRPGWAGRPYLTAADVRDSAVEATRRGAQVGFHVIGDGALDVVIAGLREAAEIVGRVELRAARPRLEHVLMPDPPAIAALGELGVVVSAQPAFEARWGGEDGMYAQRLGVERAGRLHPFAPLSAAGVALALGSDAPVTPLAPWEGVRAAAFVGRQEHRLSVRAAFTAHTRGGWRAAGRDDAGVLVPGAPATFAVWEAGDLVVQAPDARVAAWSTDPRSGVPGLPDVSPGMPTPRCLRTIVRGRTAYQT